MMTPNQKSMSRRLHESPEKILVTEKMRSASGGFSGTPGTPVEDDFNVGTSLLPWLKGEPGKRPGMKAEHLFDRMMQLASDDRLSGPEIEELCALRDTLRALTVKGWTIK